ncbi:MAG: alpha-ketoglutarate-dependent dioxygenase AlkB [Pseudomonadota bacterium]
MLFNLPTSALPPGITYLPDFISSAEETELARYLDAGDWSSELKRRVQHFGYRYDYKARRVTPESHLGPLPGWIAPLALKLANDGHFADTPDQVIANEYLPEQGISKHVDCEPCFGPVIASLSLLSPCEMVFRTLDGSAKAGIVLEPRSLVILSGEGRYAWTHEIPARQSDLIDGLRQPRSRRISLTFRTTIVGV